MKFTNDTLLFGSIPVKLVALKDKNNPILLINNTESFSIGKVLCGELNGVDLTGKLVMFNTFTARKISKEISLIEFRNIFGVVEPEDHEEITEHLDMYSEQPEEWLGKHNDR